MKTNGISTKRGTPKIWSPSTSSYLKTIYVDTVVFTPHQLAELVRVFGVDHVVMGTDYPFDMADFDPVGLIASTPGFDAATIAALAGGNAKKLLGL